MGDLNYLDLETLRDIARHSPVVEAEEMALAMGIHRLIYQTAPHSSRPHAYSYRDHFRIEHELLPDFGHVTRVVAERFQWQWIEYGWTEWKSQQKYPGKHIMGNALNAYAYGAAYGNNQLPKGVK